MDLFSARVADRQQVVQLLGDVRAVLGNATLRLDHACAVQDVRHRGISREEAMAQLLQTDRTGETAEAAALLGATFEELAPVMST